MVRTLPPAANGCTGTLPAPLVIPDRPTKLNERLSVQQGVFLRVNPPNWSFEDALTYMLAQRKNRQHLALHKLRVAPEGRLHLLKELHRMNISAESLYPGLDGFARSLIVRAEILAEEWEE